MFNEKAVLIHNYKAEIMLQNVSAQVLSLYRKHIEDGE